MGVNQSLIVKRSWLGIEEITYNKYITTTKLSIQLSRFEAT